MSTISSRRTSPLSPWGARYIETLEGFPSFASALRRGAKEAAEGSVTSFTREGATAVARVAGARGRMFETRISLTPWPPRALAKLAEEVSRRASSLAHLLAGRLPADLAPAFEETGASLLPRTPAEVLQECSCQGATAVCWHLGATHHAFARRLSTEPFLLFALRGREREELFAALRANRPAASALPVVPVPREPFPAAALEKPELFFRPGASIASLRPAFVPQVPADAVLQRLGAAPLDSEAARDLLGELHRAIGAGAAERLSEWEWRRAGGRR